MALEGTLSDLVLVQDELGDARRLHLGQFSNLVLSQVHLLQVLQRLVRLAKEGDVADLVACRVQLIDVGQCLDLVDVKVGVLVEVKHAKVLILLESADSLLRARVHVH